MCSTCARSVLRPGSSACATLGRSHQRLVNRRVSCSNQILEQPAEWRGLTLIPSPNSPRKRAMRAEPSDTGSCADEPHAGELALKTAILTVVAAIALSSCGRTVLVSSTPADPEPTAEQSAGGPGPSTAATLGIPPGHLPPVGQCRIWIPGTPPGHQGPSGDAASWPARSHWTLGWSTGPRGTRRRSRCRSTTPGGRTSWW
jgi:hypothetical protein